MKEKVKKLFDSLASQRDRWKRKNKYYYKELEKLYSSFIPENSSVLEIGCGTGELLAKIKAKRKLGIDLSPRMIEIAQKKYPQIDFIVGDAENLQINEKFDYIVMSDLLGHLEDVWKAFRELEKVSHSSTFLIINYFNYIWAPILKLGEKIGLKMPEEIGNWFTWKDVNNLLYLNNFELEKRGYSFLIPVDIFGISEIVNRHFSKLPIFRNFCLIEYIFAKKINISSFKKSYSCSVIIPCKNERDNIPLLVEKIPQMGDFSEIIFVDGNSADGTIEKIKEMVEKYKGIKEIKLIHQVEGKGKGDAVHKGFDLAKGDILMILDADLTVSPEDLPKFYLALAEGKTDFVNGTRLIYPIEKESMRFLNYLANRSFALIFTWLLGQYITDTLCGTKVLFKNDYLKIKENRRLFGDFDPFGDFDLLFGAAKLNLKIVEIPIRYKRRTYGKTKISRFSDGLLLLKMCGTAFKKLKLDR